MNIFVYAISCRSGGALSVLNDFYEEACRSKTRYPNIKWFFLLSTQQLNETGNVKIIQKPWCIKSWGLRWVFTNVTTKKLLKQYEPCAVVSLQNMMPKTVKAKKIVSLHNVLPLYKCDDSVLDTVFQRIKQKIVNREITKSLMRADAIFVPSDWIRDALNLKLKVEKSKIFVSPLRIPESSISTKLTAEENNLEKTTVFFYPAAALPYKNHQIIIDACKLLKQEGISDFKVLFTVCANQTKTAKSLSKQALDHGLNVEFVGNLPRDEVLKLYRKAVLIFPSRIETDAMPLIECRQLGGYCISADLPYSHSVLDSYKKNSFFAYNNANALKAEMLNAIYGDRNVFSNNDNEQERFQKYSSRIDTIISLSE